MVPHIKLLNFEIIRTQAEMMSEADDAFLHVHLDHMQVKSLSQDYTITSGTAIWLQNSNCVRTWANSKDIEKCSFQYRWLKDSTYQEWVLKDELDKRYARCAACEIWLIFGWSFKVTKTWPWVLLFWVWHGVSVTWTRPECVSYITSQALFFFTGRDWTSVG